MSETKMITPSPVEAELARLDKLSSDEIRRELADGVRMSAAGLVRIAACFRVLEARGEDLSELRGLLPDHIRRIAYGQLHPEAVVRFGPYPLLLDRVSRLPAPDQERLAGGGTVELIVRREDSWDRRLADPLRLTRSQVYQVFASGHIRAEAEQKLILEEKGTPPPSKKPRGKARADRERGGLVVGRVFVNQAEVLEALADLRQQDDGGGESGGEADTTLPVRLTEEEHRRIKIAAAQSDTTMSEIVRKALRAAGLI